tara:strand:+ start:271 stop:630 length:360 start_codon:yes stop_codon:yes gene_type:complete
MKTFLEHIHNIEDIDTKLLEQCLIEADELTIEQEEAIDSVVDRLVAESENGKDLETAMDEIIEEGILGSILGGLSGFALGKTVGKALAKVLGIQKGALYDLLTSRLVGAALGAVMGKRI